MFTFTKDHFFTSYLFYTVNTIFTSSVIAELFLNCESCAQMNVYKDKSTEDEIKAIYDIRSIV